MAGRGRSNPQESYFSRGIKSQTEEDSDRIHLPAPIRRREQRTEEATHEPTLIQRLI
jgi:hypothetical protein